MNNLEAAKLTVGSINVIQLYLEVGNAKAATEELNSTVYLLLSYAYYDIACDLVKEFRLLYSRYCS